MNLEWYKYLDLVPDGNKVLRGMLTLFQEGDTVYWSWNLMFAAILLCDIMPEIWILVGKPRLPNDPISIQPLVGNTIPACHTIIINAASERLQRGGRITSSAIANALQAVTNSAASTTKARLGHLRLDGLLLDNVDLRHPDDLLHSHLLVTP